MSEEWPEWKCYECNVTAMNSYHLDQQLVINEQVILTDINGDQWVRCQCDKRFHLQCTTNLPKDVGEADFKNSYICDYCGWFMSGVYDSDSA